MKKRIIEETAKFLEKLLEENETYTYSGDFIAYYRVKYYNDGDNEDYWTYAGIFSANGVFDRTYELDLDILFENVEEMELIGLTDILDPNNKPQFIKDESI
jgi:hypothetical protein